MTLIDDLRRVFKTSISFILKAVKIPRSTYYYTKHSQGRKYDDDQVIQAIDEIRQTDAKYTQKYGYRRITLVMHEQGFKVNHKRVLRIMKEQGWTCQAFNKQTRKYNSYKGVVGRIAKNKLHRRFKTDRPYQKLVADVSEFRYGQMSQSERIYLEPIMDLFSGEILAFNISAHTTLEFALQPLKEALDGLPELPYRTTIHTDQGFQYQHKQWQKTLKTHHTFQSMSRKATCLDNAAMESFFHLMKAEMMDEHFENPESLAQAMTEWIELYNNRRIRTKLKGKSPVQYRELANQLVA